MKKIMAKVSEWLDQGKDVVMATIIADSGSVPRGAGARMAITDNGVFVGTIGGGAVEYKVQQMGSDALKNKKSQIKSFVLTPNDKEDLGMVCGGDVTVYIQYISALDTNARELFAYGAELFSKHTDSWLVTGVNDAADWNMTIATAEAITGSPLPEGLQEKILASNRGMRIEIADRKYYCEPLTKAERVYVFGGGHVSQELVPLLSHLDFSCFVFDNLPKFACRELFPSADGVILGDFENISASVNITAKDFVVIMTRGHRLDLTVQAQALRLKPRYIGVIGSRKKIAVVSQKLQEMGFSQEEIETVYTPIGLAINADTPAEIAVSIAAELIMIRAGKRNLGTLRRTDAEHLGHIPACCSG